MYGTTDFLYRKLTSQGLKTDFEVDQPLFADIAFFNVNIILVLPFFCISFLG